MAWTDERVETLKKLWADGLSASQIAKELGGVTRNAVIGKVHRLGLSGRATPSRPPRRAVAPRRPRPAVRVRPAAPVAAGDGPPTAPTPRTVIQTSSVKVEPQKLPSGEYATVLTLSDHICKWPIGDPGDTAFRFCGRKSSATSPYCDAHATQAYQPPKRRRREGDEAKVALDAIAATRRISW